MIAEPGGCPAAAAATACAGNRPIGAAADVTMIGVAGAIGPFAAEIAAFV